MSRCELFWRRDCLRTCVVSYSRLLASLSSRFVELPRRDKDSFTLLLESLLRLRHEPDALVGMSMLTWSGQPVFSPVCYRSVFSFSGLGSFFLDAVRPCPTIIPSVRAGDCCGSSFHCLMGDPSVPPLTKSLLTGLSCNGKSPKSSYSKFIIISTVLKNDKKTL